MSRIVIIGGGIYGLATAYYLDRMKSGADRPYSYTLIEGASELGGKIRTEEFGGFRIERGPDSFVTHKPWAFQLCSELGLEASLIPINRSDPSFHIFSGKRLLPAPAGFRLGIPTKIRPLLTTPLLSRATKARALLERCGVYRKKTCEDESLSMFVVRHFGHEMLETLWAPLLAGIYAADPAKLSVRDAYPFLCDLEETYGSLSRGIVQQDRTKSSSKALVASESPFLTPRTGMGEIIQTLVGQLTGQVCVGESVTSLSRVDDAYRVHTSLGREIEVDSIVLASPSHCAAEYLSALDPSLSEVLAQIRFVTTATVALGFTTSDVPEIVGRLGSGILVPRAERRELLACTIASNKFSDRAPPDHTLIRVFFGGEGNEEIVSRSDDDLVKLAESELRVVIGACRPPVLHRVVRWNRGNPQRDLGHRRILEKIQTMVGRLPGVYFGGSSYFGVGISDCIRSAKETANEILQDLRQPASP